MTGQLTAIGTCLFLTFPWVLLSIFLSSLGNLVQRLCVGIVVGMAMTILFGYLLAAAGHLDSWPYAYALSFIAPLMMMLSSFGARKSGRIQGAPLTRETPPFLSKEFHEEAEPSFMNNRGLWLGLAVLVVVVTYSIPTFSTDKPWGWDPAFHSILAQKIINSHSLSRDWLPFEEISLHYSQGSHVLIAIISGWSGQAVYQTFQVLHLVIQVMAAIFVYLLAERIFREWRTALLAMLVYALLGNWGTFFSYYQWGGLPTELGALFFLALVYVSMAGSERLGVVLGVILLGNIMLVHHLSFLISAAIMGFYLLVHIKHWREDPVSIQLLKILVVTLVVFSFSVFSYLSQLNRIEGTDVLTFYEEAMITALDIPEKLGYVIFFSGIAGLVLSFQRIRGTAQRFLLCWLTALFLCFSLFDYVYRFFAILFFGKDVAAFTPSRFLTVMSYPLAIYSGYFFHTLIRYLAVSLKRFSLPRMPLRDALFAVTIVVFFVSGIHDAKSMTGNRAFTSEHRKIAAFVRENTPENAFIIYRVPGLPRDWLPYLTWRETIYTPIPASEDRAKVIKEKPWMFKPPGDPRVLKPWVLGRGLCGYVLYTKGKGQLVLEEL
jgi:asparagine N-glycosylation enzyme membrane subunit Stt3